jgi:hypothetical protein
VVVKVMIILKYIHENCGSGTCSAAISDPNDYSFVYQSIAYLKKDHCMEGVVVVV